jgi:hypothetical protein
MRNVLGGLILSAWLASASGQVTYTFAGGVGDLGNTTPQLFVLEVGDYIDEPVSFAADQLEFCYTAPTDCTRVSFDPVDPGNPLLSVLSIEVNANTTNYFYFTAGAFTRPGEYTMVYSEYFHPATLWVAGPAVPEPSTAAMMLGALGALVLFRHARR